MDEEALGVQRRSMRANRLLQRASLGRTPRPTSAPNAATSMVHGMATPASDGGAAAALGGWSPQQQQRRRATSAFTGSGRARPAPDFVRLNRTAVGQGLVTVTEQSKLKATAPRESKRDSRASLRRTREQRPGADTTGLNVPRSHTFGRPNEESAHVSELISAEPARQWHRSELERRKRQAEGRKSTGNTIVHTKTTALRQKVPEPPEEPLWHMKKYRQVPAAVQSWRSASERDAALERHRLDGVARLGAFSHGIYASGTN